MSIRDRLRRLEDRAPCAFRLSERDAQILEDYFDALEGLPVEERDDPELEAYFEELEEFERLREERRARYGA